LVDESVTAAQYHLILNYLSKREEEKDHGAKIPLLLTLTKLKNIHTTTLHFMQFR